MVRIPYVRMPFEELVRKLAGVFGVEIEAAPSARTPTSVVPADVQVKLAQLADLQAQIDANEAQLQQATAEAEAARRERRRAEVNQLTATLVAEGIPPAMIEQVKPILLADTGATVGKIKLASGEQDATASDMIIQSLRALPDFFRVRSTTHNR